METGGLIFLRHIADQQKEVKKVHLIKRRKKELLHQKYACKFKQIEIWIKDKVSS